MRRTTQRLLLSAMLLVLPFAAQACRQALVLGLDVSLSVNAIDFRLQREGLAQALEDHHVARAMIGGGESVELAVFEWTGQFNQNVLVDWTVIDSRDTLGRIARDLRETRQWMRSGRTALGASMIYARDMLLSRGHCDQLTFDISGDGVNNNGVLPVHVRGDLEALGITVNALVIEPEPGKLTLSRYFHDQVITGPTAFVETIYGFDAYAEAIKRKLLRELTPSLSYHAPRPRREAVQRPRPDLPAHKPQGGMTDMRRHPADLTVAPL